MQLRAAIPVGLALIAASLVGCDRPAPSPPVAKPAAAPACSYEQLMLARREEAEAAKAMVVEPAAAQIDAGDPGLQLVVTQRSLATGEVRDLTTSAVWKVEPAGVVVVDAAGYLRPVGQGRVVLFGTVANEPGAVRAEVMVGPPGERGWNFAEDVEPLLTRLGCNTGGCHARLDGQNGFHLSLYGYDAEGDHRALTRDALGRRVNRLRPEASLLLTKATGNVPHGGGLKLVAGSEAYRTLLGWIRAGAPLASPKNHGRLARLAVEPGESRLDGPGPRQLRVVAHYEDGHSRDVTRLASYKTLDDSTVAVDAEGHARLLRRGEADVVVRYESQVASARIAAAVNPALAHDFAKDPRANFIDDEVLKRLASLKVPPTPPASDAAFLRRVALDLTGEQPSPDQVRDFLKDADPAKRARLVRSLVGSADFVRFWQIKLGDLLEITSARPDLGNAAITYTTWVKKQLLDNAPWDQIVRALLTSVGDPADRETGGPVAYSLEAADPKVAAEKTARRFLGLRLQCAQCHDHPFDVWTQDDYFGLAAAFAKVDRSAPGMGGMMMANRTVIRVNAEGAIANPRTHQPAVGKALGGPSLATKGEEDPRARLADWMTAPDNPFFARAMANWVWAQFFGAGIANPPDDLSRSNPPVHPELLDALAKHFVAHKYDLRDLITTIATSNTYAAGSAAVPGNEGDARLFSHQRPRPLTAHQMAEALARVTDVANIFKDKKGQTALDINDPVTPSAILDAFGRCNRINGCAAVDTPSLSLRQSLLLIGGDVIESKVTHPRGYLASLLELSPGPDEVVENLYLRALCRPPTSEELAHWTAQLGQASSLREAAEDLFWALLNSREFAFNH